MEQNLKSIEENVLESCLHSSVSLSRKPPQFAQWLSRSEQVRWLMAPPFLHCCDLCPTVSLHFCPPCSSTTSFHSAAQMILHIYRSHYLPLRAKPKAS